MPRKGEPRGPGRGGTSSHLQIQENKKKKSTAQGCVSHKQVFSGFSTAPTICWELSQNPRQSMAGQGTNQSSPLAPGCGAMLGGGQGHPPFILGVLWAACLQGQVVLLSHGAGLASAQSCTISWMEAWGRAILKEIVEEKTVTPGRELGASSPDCHAPLTPCLVKERNKLKTGREKNLCFESTDPWLAEQLLPGAWAQEWNQTVLRVVVWAAKLGPGPDLEPHDFRKPKCGHGGGT